MSQVLQADVSRKRQELGKWQALVRKVQRATGVSDPHAVGQELLAQDVRANVTMRPALFVAVTVILLGCAGSIRVASASSQ